jgi:hypothetical protein
MAALSLRNSATAGKLAILIYCLLRWGQQDVDEGAEAFDRRYQEIRMTALKAKAKELGYEVVQSAQAPSAGEEGTSYFRALADHLDVTSTRTCAPCQRRRYQESRFGVYQPKASGLFPNRS